MTCRTPSRKAIHPVSSSNSSSSDDNPNRPKLRRASSSSDSVSSNSSSSSSSSGDDDPDRLAYSAARAPLPAVPRTAALRTVLRAVPAATTMPTARSSAAQALPPADLRAGASNSASNSSNSSSGDYDADRPILQRRSGCEQRLQFVIPDPDLGFLQHGRGRAAPAFTPSDANGVTRKPPHASRLPKTPTAAHWHVVRSMRASSGDDIIDQAREEAFSFTETLPNYVASSSSPRAMKPPSHVRARPHGTCSTTSPPT